MVAPQSPRSVKWPRSATPTPPRPKKRRSRSLRRSPQATSQRSSRRATLRGAWTEPTKYRTADKAAATDRCGSAYTPQLPSGWFQRNRGISEWLRVQDSAQHPPASASDQIPGLTPPRSFGHPKIACLAALTSHSLAFGGLSPAEVSKSSRRPRPSVVVAKIHGAALGDACLTAGSDCIRWLARGSAATTTDHAASPGLRRRCQAPGVWGLGGRRSRYLDLRKRCRKRCQARGGGDLGGHDPRYVDVGHCNAQAPSTAPS